jgi:hypothetical protein
VSFTYPTGPIFAAQTMGEREASRTDKIGQILAVGVNRS